MFMFMFSKYWPLHFSPPDFFHSGLKHPPYFLMYTVPCSILQRNQLFNMLSANKHHSKYYCSSSWYEISTWICLCCWDCIQCDWSNFLQSFLQYSWTPNNHAISRKGDKMYPKWNDSLKLMGLSGVGPDRLFSKFPLNILFTDSHPSPLRLFGCTHNSRQNFP